jgi:hypothetical protein
MALTNIQDSEAPVHESPGHCITALKSALNLQQTAAIDAGAFADGVERENAKLRTDNEKLLHVKEAVVNIIERVEALRRAVENRGEETALAKGQMIALFAVYDIYLAVCEGKDK